MNEFKNYHPVVNFCYFVLVIGFSMFFMHPICLIISFLSAFLYSVILKGKDALKNNLMYFLPLMIIMALMNPMFNHEGVTIIEYLPSGNPLTLESVVYGFSASLMIVTVILWFSCYNVIMTSDKFIYLFGRIIPSMSLILSMTLRFVPRFSKQLKTVVNAQRCLGRDISKGNIIKRIKNGVKILSIMITWALENSIEVADSMRSRGYGVSGRTAYSIFIFDKRDMTVLSVICVLGVYIIFGRTMGNMDFGYFPSMKGTENSFFQISVFVSYLGLCICPTIIEIIEVMRWKLIKSKI